MMDTDKKSSAAPWRIAGWGFAVLLLLIPAVAMQFGGEVDWTASDFVVAAALLGSVGFGFEMVARSTANWRYRAGVIVAILTAFLLVWANLAVGFLGDPGNPLNLSYFAMLIAGGAAAALTRFRARPMAAIMAAMAMVQLVTAIAGAAAGYVELAPTVIFISLWLLSAWLFRKAI